MKKLTLAIFLALAACAAMAQGQTGVGGKQGGGGMRGGPGGQRGGGFKMPTPAERAQRMQKELGLNPAQTKKVEAHYTKQGEEMKKEMKGKDFRSMSREDMGKMRDKMMKSNQAAFKGIFTKDQYAKWDKAQKERQAKMMERMKNGGGQRGPGGPGKGKGGA